MPEAQRTDPLADLRARLEATREAAERLADEAGAARAADQAGADPGPGWRTEAEREALRGDLGALAATLGQLTELIPAELREQLAELLRLVLLLLRALLDWLVERLPATPGDEPAVEAIPLD